jgi:hypothetical protein
MWASYYGYITNRVVDRYSTQDELRREEISQGVTRENVDMLLKTVHPLDLFQKENYIRDRIIGLQSEANEMQQAFVAAAALIDKLQHGGPDSITVIGGVYHTDHKSNMPIVYDTGASYSVTLIASDFVTEIEPTANHQELAISLPRLKFS